MLNVGSKYRLTVDVTLTGSYGSSIFFVIDGISEAIEAGEGFFESHSEELPPFELGDIVVLSNFNNPSNCWAVTSIDAKAKCISVNGMGFVPWSDYRKVGSIK